jgi:hypothetical protein
MTLISTAVRRILASIVLCGLLPAAGAQADVITFSFGGEITMSEVAGIAVGDSISGQYTFDSAATATFPLFPTVAQYDFALLSYAVQIGSFSVTASSGRILVANGFSGSIDVYGVGSDAIATTPVAGLTPHSSFFELVDASQTAIVSFALPLTPPDPSSFGVRTFSVRFVDADNVSFRATGSLAFLAAVPAPGALLLLGFGCLVMAADRSRRRRAVRNQG